MQPLHNSDHMFADYSSEAHLHGRPGMKAEVGMREKTGSWQIEMTIVIP